jgi:FkbM family methyltransferase
MFDLEERPDAFNLKEATVHNTAAITGGDPLAVTTPPQQWAFAVSFLLHDDPKDPLEGHGRMIIRLDATVEEGGIGVSVASPNASELISKEDRQGAAGRTTFEVLLNSPRPGVRLVVRNTAAGGGASRVKIHGIRAYLAHARQFKDSSSSVDAAELTAEDSSAPERSDFISQVMAPAEIWLDVGAHLGEKTFSTAADNPRLRVYAFEPNLRMASRLMGQLPNYVVLPMAIAERDGSSTFYLNRYSECSSLLPFVPEGLKEWVGGEVFQVEAALTVPTIRLDTFLNQAGIGKVAYLKTDTQGCDLTVIRSAGERLRDIERISLEVQTTLIPLYRDACRKEEVLAFLTGAGFELISSEKQSHDQEENLTFVRRSQTLES